MIDFFGFIGKFIRDGGFFMYPITLLFAFGLAVVIERFFVLFKKFNLDNAKFFNFIEQKLLANEIEEIIKTNPDVPLANISKFGVEFFVKLKNEPDSEKNEIKNHERIEKAVEEVASIEFPKIERRLNLMTTVANLSTLLGLLGTLQGLIQSFSSLSTVEPSLRSSMLSQGISVAMNTTAYGLFVAVIMLFMHAILSSRAERIAQETEYYTLRFVNLITTRK